MLGDIPVLELWALRLNPSDLYNIERVQNPEKGGGQRYVQIGTSLVDDTLAFLRTGYDQLPVTLSVRSIGSTLDPEEVVFDAKSGGRLRIANQNRHSQRRCRAWSPESGFPVLGPSDATPQAQQLLDGIGGVHLFLVRDDQERIWAGFTQGEHTPASMAGFEFASLLYERPGGYWRYRGELR